MAEDAFKQFAKMELVKVCEPLYIFYYQYRGPSMRSVPLVVGEFLIGPQKRRGIPFGTPLRGIVSQNLR